MTNVAGARWWAARHAGRALMLLLGACAADSDAAAPECIAARERFQQMWPMIANAFGLSGVPPGNARPEIVGGSFGSAISRIPDRGARQRCYETTMRAFGFFSYPPFEQVDALRR